MSKDLLQFVKKIEKSQLKTMHKKYNDARFAEVAKLLENVQFWSKKADTHMQTLDHRFSSRNAMGL